MPLFSTGIGNAYTYNGVIITPIYGVAINFFANRTPLFSRLPLAPLGALSFKVTSDNFRPTTTTISNSGNVGSGDTTMGVADGSSFMVGDVIEVDSEQMLVTSVSSNTLTVTRGYAGTSAASHTDTTTTVYLVGNTRTGSEVDQTGVSRIPATATQYAQTFQHPYQVGGSLASATAYALPPGVASFVGRERMYAMQNCSDDIERAMYYGKAKGAGAATDRQQMAGLRSLITTNNVTAPTNAAAYKPADLIRDTIQACYTNGGNPDLLVVSTDHMSGLSIWGHAIQRIDAGETMFGTPIKVFSAPFLDDIQIVPAPLLRSGTVICLSSGEVRNRVKRAMFDKPRGSRGDADEGDIIAEQAIELDNEAHHAWVSGITAFSAS